MHAFALPLEGRARRISGIRVILGSCPGSDTILAPFCLTHTFPAEPPGGHLDDLMTPSDPFHREALRGLLREK